MSLGTWVCGADAIYCTVYYIVPFLCCNQLKLIDIPAATNSSKAKEARSNRALFKSNYYELRPRFVPSTDICKALSLLGIKISW